MASTRSIACQSDQPRGERNVTNALDARRPDAARRVVEDPAEADLVGAVERQLQVREEILHLLALEELLPADDLVRHHLLAERLLDRLRLPVRPVEHRHLARQDPLVPDRLADLRIATHSASASGDAATTDRTLAPPQAVGEEDLLVLRVEAPLDDRVGHVEYRLHRAVVLLEPQALTFARGEVLVEVEVCCAPRRRASRESTGAVVPHDAEVLQLAGEQAEHLELRALRVLVLVD